MPQVTTSMAMSSESAEVQRKLTTILAADAEGYSRVMEADEVGTLAALRAARAVFKTSIARHHGRIANTAGDSLIAEFPSVVEAVQCAVEVQRELDGRGAGPAAALRFRIGVHLGDVIVDGSDLLGEGVNLAARLQSLAEPGGILISQQVYDQVQHKLSVSFEYLGAQHLKNLTDDVAVYRVSPGGPLHGAAHAAQAAMRAAHAPHRPTHAAPVDDLRARVTRHAKLLGAAWAVLLIVDLATGSPFWAHWPGLALATLVGLQAMPLFVSDRFGLRLARGAVIVAALALVNLFSWSGYPWVLWPAGALAAVALLHRWRARVH
jgi:adenylate cyclase